MREGARGPMDVDLPVGRFKNCWCLESLGGAAWDMEHWLCPGVGIVQQASSAYGGSSYYAQVANLVRYHIADLPER